MKRFRRLRKNQTLRDLVAETSVDIKKLICPVFVRYGEDIKEEILSMPGVFRYSADRLREVAELVAESGIAGVLLFGIPEEKDACGSGACDADGVVPRAIRALKKYQRESGTDFLIAADICLCEYTSHGHCGLLKDGEVDNDASLPVHARAAVAAARAGADMIAPSSMMDGVTEAIRLALDEAGFAYLPIMGYSAKFASAFYGPFRDAAESAPQCGDRKSYQMDFRNGREAMRELAADEEAGADILMVKPALAYLDLVREARARTDKPIAVYNVSGEYSMVKAAAKEGWIDGERIEEEILTSFFRAGADIVISYHALDYALRKKGKNR